MSPFKLECDALLIEEWFAIGELARRVLPAYQRVEGVPKGGLNFQMAMVLEQTLALKDPLLIVDDVWTTGGSMEKQRAQRPAIGCVLFARGPVADWVTPLFTLHEGLWRL